MAHKTEFLYLSEPDTIAAGVLDVPKCINNAEEVFTLLAKGDYLMGGNNHNNHGMYIVFPKESPFPNMPVAGPDRRFVAMPAYLGGRFDICGQKWYGSNAANKSKGLPRSVLMVTLNNKDTGEPLAYMSANLLSAARTGAVPGVATRHLARKDAEVLLCIGCGAIGTSCLNNVITQMPNVKKVICNNHSVAPAEKLAAHVREQIGIIGLIDNEFPKRGLHVDGVVSCEATALKIYCGHRGRVEINVEVAGVTSHGASPWLGINAVNKATKLIDAVEAYYAEHYQVDEKLGKSSIALTVINCTPGTMCIVPDRCNITYDRRLVPTETPEDAIAEIQAIIDRLSAEDPDFHATVKVSAVPRTTYTGITETKPNIKEGWRIAEDHPFVAAASNGLRSIGEPVSYGYWDFGTDLAMVSGRHHIASIGYSPMQEYYCHRPVDKCRIDFMERALVGNIAIFQELTKLSGDDFKI